MADLNALAATGNTIVNMNPAVSQLLSQRYSSTAAQTAGQMVSVGGQRISPAEVYSRGFKIGTAASRGFSLEGPTQDAVRDQASQEGGIYATYGFNDAREQQYAFSKAGIIMLITGTEAQLPPDVIAQIDSLFLRGSQIAQSTPAVLAGSMSNPSPAFQKGFYVATAFCTGMNLDGPNQQAMRKNVVQLYGAGTADGANAGKGFDLGQAMQFGLTNARATGAQVSGNPSVAAGQLTVGGVAGASGLSANQKAAAVGTVIANNPAAAAGAQSAIAAAKPGIFKRFFQFLGLA